MSIFLNQYPHMVNYQHYSLNLTHGHTPNNRILNTKIGIKFHFPFTTHHIVQCTIIILYIFFIKKNKKKVLFFKIYKSFLYFCYIEAWYLIFFMKLILVWLVLIHQVILWILLYLSRMHFLENINLDMKKKKNLK